MYADVPSITKLPDLSYGHSTEQIEWQHRYPAAQAFGQELQTTLDARHARASLRALVPGSHLAAHPRHRLHWELGSGSASAAGLSQPCTVKEKSPVAD